MIKLAVFDWNGTIIADSHAGMDAENHILKLFGGRRIGMKRYRETFTIPAIDFYAANGCDRSKLLRNSRKLGDVFIPFYEKRAAKCRSRKGAKRLLTWLRGRRVESVLLSNHTIEGIEMQLERLGIGGHISKVLANRSGATSMKARNKLQKLRGYMKTKGYKKSEVAIIGDSPEEIGIARALGIRCIAITGGSYSTARLRASAPDFLVDSLKEVVGILGR